MDWDAFGARRVNMWSSGRVALWKVGKGAQGRAGRGAGGDVWAGLRAAWLDGADRWGSCTRARASGAPECSPVGVLAPFIWLYNGCKGCALLKRLLKR